MKHILLLCISFFLIMQEIKAQGCCSGGSGSPMVGGISMGVLQKGQFDVSESFQYFYSDQFLAGDNKDTSSATVHDLKTSYLYTRLGYGISERLSLYAEVGYYIQKTETGFDPERPDYTKTASGIADLIILPRYNVFEQNSARSHNELSLGIGLKIPLGNYHDSTTVWVDPSSGDQINMVSPPTVQPTSGSNDFIFYGFYLHEIKKNKLKLFTSVTYMHKGYNAMGEKFGDFLGVGLFASKMWGRKWGLTGQLRYEWIDKMKLSPNVDLIANGIVLEPESTGGKKFSFVPQVTYSKKSLTLYALYDFPIYQYMNGMQVANKYLLTLGFTYRFKLNKSVFTEVK